MHGFKLNGIIASQVLMPRGEVSASMLAYFGAIISASAVSYL